MEKIYYRIVVFMFSNFKKSLVFIKMFFDRLLIFIVAGVRL